MGPFTFVKCLAFMRLTISVNAIIATRLPFSMSDYKRARLYLFGIFTEHNVKILHFGWFVFF